MGIDSAEMTASIGPAATKCRSPLLEPPSKSTDRQVPAAPLLPGECVASPTGDDETDWEYLQQTFLSLEACPGLIERQSQVYALLLHPASQRQLRLASNRVLRRWSRHADLRADVEQEATLRLAADLLQAAFSYEDRGPAQFGGWLWCRWFDACRCAWRHCQPLSLRRIAHSPSDMLEELAARDCSPSPAQLLVQHVRDQADAALRETLIDWLEGDSLRKTAARRRVSKSVVDRLRKRLVALFDAARRDDGERLGVVPSGTLRQPERRLTQPSG